MALEPAPESLCRTASMAGEAPREPVRRSLTALANLSAGTVLTMDDLVWVRPGGGLRPGQEDRVLGKTLVKDLAASEAMSLEHVESGS